MDRANEAQLIVAFGSKDPELARFPHVIFPATHGFVDIAMSAVNEPIAVWGSESPYASKDVWATEDSTELFYEWRCPESQKYAREFGAKGELQGFTMIIPLNTPRELISLMYKEMWNDSAEYWYPYCIQKIHVWINALRWAYIPLEYEAQFGMFVAGVGQEELVDRVRQAFTPSCQRLMFSVDVVDGSLLWNGPHHVDGRALFPENFE